MFSTKSSTLRVGRYPFVPSINRTGGAQVRGASPVSVKPAASSSAHASASLISAARAGRAQLDEAL
jgi:hypothetical protein